MSYGTEQFHLIPELQKIAEVFGLDVEKVAHLVQGFKYTQGYSNYHETNPRARSLNHVQAGVANNFNTLMQNELDRRDQTPEQGLLTLLDALWYTAMARYTLETPQKGYVDNSMAVTTFRQAVKQFYRGAGINISLNNQVLIETELKLFEVANESYDAFKYISSPELRDVIMQVYYAQEAKYNRHNIKAEQLNRGMILPELPSVTLAGLFALLPDTIPVPVVAQVVGDATHFSPLEISDIINKILDAYQTTTA